MAKVLILLESLDRTPAWLCRRAGVAHSTFTRVVNGERNLTERLKYKFSNALGVEKAVLFPDNKNKGDK